MKGIQAVLSLANFEAPIRLIGRGTLANRLSADNYQNDHLIRLADRSLVQVDSKRILNKLSADTFQWPEKPIILMILDKDLNTQIVNQEGHLEWINFIFGQAMPEVGTLISVYRFRRAIPNLDKRLLTLRLIGAHEFGDILGLVKRKTTTAETKGGIYEHHCINLCAKRKVMSIKEALKLAISLEGSRKTILCRDCQEELKGRFQ